MSDEDEKYKEPEGELYQRRDQLMQEGLERFKDNPDFHKWNAILAVIERLINKQYDPKLLIGMAVALAVKSGATTSEVYSHLCALFSQKVIDDILDELTLEYMNVEDQMPN